MLWRILCLLLLFPAVASAIFPPFILTTGVDDGYVWSLGDLAAYEARIPLLAAHDWSNSLDSLAEVQAAWTGETVVDIDAVDCDPNTTPGNNEDRSAIQAALGNDKILNFTNVDSGGFHAVCYYDFSTQLGGTYNRMAWFGQGMWPDTQATVLNYDVQPANRTTNVANALQLGTESGLSGSAIAYVGSLARGDTTLTVASGTWAVNDSVVVRSTDPDGEDTQISSFLTAVSGSAPTITLTMNDPIPYQYSTGTITRQTGKSTDLVIVDMAFDTPLAWRGTCAEQASLGDCRYLDIPNRSRTVLKNVNFIKVPRSAIYTRYSNNTVLETFVMSENLSMSRNGTRNSTVPNSNALEGGTDRIFNGFFRQGAGRLYGKPVVAGNTWYGMLAFDDDQSMIGDPVTGYANAGATVHDTGDFYGGSRSTDDAVFPMNVNNAERLWFHHDCADASSENTAPNIFEASEIEGLIGTDGDCVSADLGRYHTFFRLYGEDQYADLEINSGSAVYPYSNWIYSKLNSRTMTTSAKANTLNLYNLYGSVDANSGTGSDYVSTGEETGTGTLTACRSFPPSVVLRQDEPPCTGWCSEYGDASDNYGWNNDWTYGACATGASQILPMERLFLGLSCTPAPTCVDY